MGRAARRKTAPHFSWPSLPVKAPFAGGLFLLSAVLLTGCVAPLTQREAQSYAQLSLRRYCSRTMPCHPARFVKAQHMPSGWLLDYESDTVKYGVMVHENGGTEVSVWDKSAAAR